MRWILVAMLGTCVGALAGCAPRNDALIIQTSPIYHPTSSGGYWDERGLFLEMYANEGAPTSAAFAFSGSVTSVNRSAINVTSLAMVFDGQREEVGVEIFAVETHELDTGEVALIERFVCDIDADLAARLARAADIGMQARGPAGETPVWYFSGSSRKALRSIYRRGLP